MSSDSRREEVLAAIRRSLDSAGCRDADPSGAYEKVSRGYARRGELDAAGRIALFEERLEDYGVLVCRISAAEIPRAVGERLAARGVQRLAIPAGLPREWLPAGLTAAEGDDLSAAELDGFDGVLTACSAAIAETGTVVLQAGPAQGPRRLSLVPDYHLCVVAASQIVETVPEVFARLEESSTRPATFVSGPSATSDIEMTRVRGVHGPRTLDVLIVLDGKPAFAAAE